MKIIDKEIERIQNLIDIKNNNTKESSKFIFSRNNTFSGNETSRL